MSEYWVSQGRKMCTYCKCWTADNKASIAFHENGKNHKENVRKKLDELRKKGLDDAKKRDQASKDMKKMEKAALEALKKDIAANPSMAAAYGIAPDKVEAVQNAIKNEQASPSVSSKGPKLKKPGAKHTASALSIAADRVAASAASAQKEDQGQHYQGDWNVTQTPEGYTYYWNTVTSETSWYAPDAQPETSEHASDTTESATADTASSGDNEEKTESDTADETPTTEQNEATGESEKEKVADIPTPNPIVVPRNPRGQRAAAYGSWSIVTEEAIPQLDLPTDSKNYETVANDIPLPPEKVQESKPDEPPSKRFKEKVVALKPTAAGSSNVTFKKRKFGGARQSRKKADEDDD